MVEVANPMKDVDERDDELEELDTTTVATMPSKALAKTMVPSGDDVE